MRGVLFFKYPLSLGAEKHVTRASNYAIMSLNVGIFFFLFVYFSAHTGEVRRFKGLVWGSEYLIQCSEEANVDILFLCFPVRNVYIRTFK